MNDKTKRTFARAGIDIANLREVAGTAVHKFMVKATAYLDADEGLLMFVGELPAEVSRFLYYIGEERNSAVVGVGAGIVAYQIDEERIEWLLRLLPEAGAAT